MTIFYCEDSFEAMMTCIYYAWASKLGYKSIQLKAGVHLQRELFCDYIFIEPEQDKAESVSRSIQKKISFQAYSHVFKTAMSEDPDKLHWIYLFLLLGFSYGRDVLKMLREPAVERVMSLSRRVGNEAHLYREFMRFHVVPPQIYMSHFEPDNNVISFLAEHFQDRMPSEHWMIIDDKRKLAAVHSREEEYYLTDLTEEELDILRQSEKSEDRYTNLWKNFFRDIGIKERKNLKCQRNMMPLKYRKYVVEFKEE